MVFDILKFEVRYESDIVVVYKTGNNICNGPSAAQEIFLTFSFLPLGVPWPG